MANRESSDSGGSGAMPHTSRTSHDSHSSHSSHRIIPPRGDYRNLLTYQKAEVIYDITFNFCGRFLKRGDRTVDQMIQAARSGKPNIVEGSKAGTTSKESESKLTNVARASLEELLQDYGDYLRVRGLPIWEKDSREATYARTLGKKTPFTYETVREIVETRDGDVVANLAICIIHQTNYLLDCQLASLERAFLRDGGLRERMTRERLDARSKRGPNQERGTTS